MASLKESWISKAEEPAELSAVEVKKQELLKQCQLKKHVDKLETDVQKKEDMVNRLR